MPHKSNKPRHSSPAMRTTQPISLVQARRLTKKQPHRADSWHALGMALVEVNQWHEAREALQRADRLTPHHPAILEGLARTTHKCGDAEAAVSLFEASLRQDPNRPQAHFSYAHLLLEREQYSRALAHIDQALDLVPGHLDMLSHRGVILYKLHRYSDAIQVFDQLLERQPGHYSHWNNAANLRRDLGLLDEADVYYKESIKRTKNDAKPYSNRLTALHYKPHASREAILDVCREWERHYAPRLASLKPAEIRQPNKTLRIGMISDGFRQHPVGKMISRVLAAISKSDIKLLAYSTNSAVDPLTISIQRSVDQWMSVTHMTAEQLGQQVLDDKVDILIDLCGHNAGSRMPTMAMKPAPVQVKWVGGLINTTGLSTMDYLLSDSVETPEGEDEFYVEKLIRLPDDYICYDPGEDQPDSGPLPATLKGHVTFGCFNNPSKINETVLTQWALIMHELPESQLFLKGFQFNSDDLCQRVRSLMETQGIAPERVIIEGPSPHLELMEAYRRVDIALDPWPYSGGLTTCEALIMGVPVVTLPGPTFAGRHSATHLVNAGMPELVVNSWDEYRERALELASDLDSLATIRQHLRQVLLESPVCDAPRFARHFTSALRAIWQRYCEGKEPAALTFDKEGQATFDGESEPVGLVEPEEVEGDADEFRWSFSGKVIVLDNGAKLMQCSAGIDGLLKLGAFGVVAFDSASRVANPERFATSEDVQLLPHATLGDGQPATLYATLDPAASATLEPLPAECLSPEQAQATRVMTTLPVNTVTLDSIEGLESLDWLILDDKSDAVAVLENGTEALEDTLLLQVRLAFQPTHRQQPDFAQVSHWASRHGFRFYRFNDEHHRTQLPDDVPASQLQATELDSADALYLPSHERMASLSDNQRIKLAFLLDTVFGAKDMAYGILESVSEEKAAQYLVNLGYRRSEKSHVEVEAEDGAQGFPIPEAPFMTPNERALFKESLQAARRYFEFGSGGSTVWAVNQGLTVFGVESDDQWVNGLKGKLGERCQVKAVDIGPTREWGYPVSLDNAELFADYSKEILNHKGEFDLILVDGRFRVACVMAAIQHILMQADDPEAARIFVHDFWNRPNYHVVLEFLETVKRSESAGVFKVKSNIDTDNIERIWEEYAAQPA